ncbi:SpoIIE family protein phosphatase [Micromonospora sp. D93]|uniref:SpoIIE family protein phosphatase n=1 Tax=Micromonospora sp. D93 TaxID=2824886 RepID=UPI001B384424|nr:SpoIIE family protein phosphatase [Micromonospora sp. D93]MBQ1016794.1 SpoIIE family protein phosphatase [Micromonospora sp. D93]
MQSCGSILWLTAPNTRQPPPAPLFAAAVETPRRTTAVSATATTAAVAAGLPSGLLGSLDHLLRVAVVSTIIIIGDVCGKGVAAVRLASAVTGAFRQSAIVRPDLAQVARDLDQFVAREPMPAKGSTFVTAVLVELRGDEIRTVNCGHPAVSGASFRCARYARVWPNRQWTTI